MEKEQELSVTAPDRSGDETCHEEPQVIEEIIIEELSIDGVCGVY